MLPHVVLTSRWIAGLASGEVVVTLVEQAQFGHPTLRFGLAPENLKVAGIRLPHYTTFFVPIY